MWDFQTEPEFQEKLDWMDTFIREEIEPLDQVLDVNVFESPTGGLRELINQLSRRCATATSGRATSSPSSVDRVTARSSSR